MENNELRFRRLIEVEQVATDYQFIFDSFDGALTEEVIIALLDLAYKREIHNRDYNQAASHFDKRLRFDKEVWSGTNPENIV